MAHVLLGWVFVIMRNPLRTTGLELLTVGCVLYTAGVGVFLSDDLPYQILVWHSFVVTSAALRYGLDCGIYDRPDGLKTGPSSGSR
ncbi:MAG: hypothetical protein LCH56_08540 [Proteobacteria bacterium]|nr:hypothetical protein [Pseudomonadota bacterium]